jgi:hypothetical protein
MGLKDRIVLVACSVAIWVPLFCRVWRWLVTETVLLVLLSFFVVEIIWFSTHLI